MKLISKVFFAVIIFAAPAFADKRLDELTAITTPASGDLYYCIQGSADYKCTLSQIRGWNGVSITGGTITGITDLDVFLAAGTNVFIDGRTSPRAITQGALRIEQTPSIAGTRAINIDINSNGQPDTNAIVVDYVATNHVPGFETHGLDVSVDTDGSTGGDFQAMSVSKTGSGTLNVVGMETYSGVSPVIQKSGSAVAIDTAFTYSGAAFTDVTTNINSTGTNSQLFGAQNDYLYLGKTTTFNEMQATLAVLSSNSILPTFEYSQGAGVWVSFGPSDGTNGFQQTGNISWATALTGWAVDTVNAQGGRYWIRIKRTRNNINTPPTESIIKLVTDSEYSWDANGNLIVNTVNAKGNSYFGMAGSSSHPVEARKDGAGFQTILAVENQQTAAANVGPQIMFEGASNTDMASVQSGWNGAATTDAYLAWVTRSSGAMGERMRLTSGGNLGIGATPVNKLDVEGGAVIGATYSGATTAPANGLLVEGNVGIGTSSNPNYPLMIRKDTAGLSQSINLENDTTPANGVGSQINFSGSTGIIGQFLVDWESATGAEGRVRIYTRKAGVGTEALRITSQGYVGIAAGTAIAPTEALDINSNSIRIRTAKTPASATDTCDQGEISWDASYVYVCVATNSWKRSAIAAW